MYHVVQGLLLYQILNHPIQDYHGASGWEIHCRLLDVCPITAPVRLMATRNLTVLYMVLVHVGWKSLCSSNERSGVFYKYFRSIYDTRGRSIIWIETFRQCRACSFFDWTIDQNARRSWCLSSLDVLSRQQWKIWPFSTIRHPLTHSRMPETPHWTWNGHCRCRSTRFDSFCSQTSCLMAQLHSLFSVELDHEENDWVLFLFPCLWAFALHRNYHVNLPLSHLGWNIEGLSCVRAIQAIGKAKQYWILQPTLSVTLKKRWNDNELYKCKEN